MFDFLTFGILLLVLNASPAEFRTGWFVESMVSASLVVLVIRTRRAFFRSTPSRYLLGATLAIVLLTPLIPYTPLGRIFRFTPLPVAFLVLLGSIVFMYMAVAGLITRQFYRRES